MAKYYIFSQILDFIGVNCERSPKSRIVLTANGLVCFEIQLLFNVKSFSLTYDKKSLLEANFYWVYDLFFFHVRLCSDDDDDDDDDDDADDDDDEILNSFGKDCPKKSNVDVMSPR